MINPPFEDMPTDAKRDGILGRIFSEDFVADFGFDARDLVNLDNKPAFNVEELVDLLFEKVNAAGSEYSHAIEVSLYKPNAPIRRTLTSERQSIVDVINESPAGTYVAFVLGKSDLRLPDEPVFFRVISKGKLMPLRRFEKDIEATEK
jgi:hypothetical protein